MNERRPISSPLARAVVQPLDATVALLARFRGDPRSGTLNLAGGTFVDPSGVVPLMRAVHRAEMALAAERPPRDYPGMSGDEGLVRAAHGLLLGEERAQALRPRLAALQTLGGTGALRVAADLLRALTPDATVYVSRPTWGNHAQIFEAAGFRVAEHPYVDAATATLDFDGMCAGLRAAAPGSIVVLHTSCHNPTGVDPSAAQWDRLADLFLDRQLVAVHDIAYQGLGEGLDEDVRSLRIFIDRGVPTLVAHSLSKTFSLYGERVGTLSVACADAGEAHRVGSTMHRIVRTNYSTPPIHGAALIRRVLADAALRDDWRVELHEMSCHVAAMRVALVDGLRDAGLPLPLDALQHQRGLFCFSGIPADKADWLRTEMGVYLLRNGRICLAAMQASTIRRFVEATKLAYAAVT